MKTDSTPITTRKGSFYQGRTKLTLAGNHTWNTVQPFDGRTTSIDQLTGNFTRLWTVETRGMVLQGAAWGSRSRGTVRVGNVPWKNDGRLNKRFYQNLERVVAEADAKDMVVGVVLFDHAFNAYFPQGWENHPFNGLGPRSVHEIHTVGPWNKYQRAHVRKVVRTLKDYDNVIYEVGNELSRNSVSSGFQKRVVSWVDKFDSDALTGVSYASGLYADQSWMTRVGADWIAPNNAPRSGGVRKLPGFSGPQVLDTDHAWALGSNVSGLRIAASQGRPLWVMDGMDGYILRNQGSLQPDYRFINSLVS